GNDGGADSLRGDEIEQLPTTQKGDGIIMSRYISGLAVFFVAASCSHAAWPQSATSFSYTTIDVPFAGALNTRANGANDRGDVVGRYEDATGVHGFLLSQGAYTPIDVPISGLVGTQARGIDARGSIVGVYVDGSGDHGFLAKRWLQTRARLL